MTACSTPKRYDLALWSSASRAHNCYYEPCSFHARKGMLHRFNFVNFSGGCYQRAQVSDTLGRNVGQVPLEELVESQAISVDLREAVMACLSGAESRRWTVSELVERFKNLGVCASRCACGPGHFFHTAVSVFYVFCFEHMRDDTCPQLKRSRESLLRAWDAIETVEPTHGYLPCSSGHPLGQLLAWLLRL
jgi:hypothetical protein